MQSRIMIAKVSSKMTAMCFADYDIIVTIGTNENRNMYIIVLK